MKKFIYIISALFLVLHILYVPVYGQEVPGFVENELDSYIETAMQKWKIPGLSLAIVKDGEIVIAKGYGVLTRGKPQKADENSLFMIASNTKAFVGTSMAWLEYEKKCSLGDKMVSYVPEFAMNDPWVTRHVTITDVLSHQIGLSTFQGDFLYFYSNLTKEDIYKKFPLLIPENGFREKFGYCNAGFFWAGECMKSITGETWDVFIQERILDPLEMSRTKVLSKGLDKEKNLASVHTIQDDEIIVLPHPDIDRIGPAASMSSSALDMSHWMIAQLDSGNYKGKNIIPQEVIKRARKPEIEIGRSSHPFNTSHYSLYGLGWEMEDYENREIISHTGGLIGFVSSVSLVPEENLGIVVLTNSDKNWFYDALKWEIIDAYLDLPKRNYSDIYYNVYQSVTKNRKEKISAIHDTIAMNNVCVPGLEAYTGKYQNKVYGEVEILREDDHLLMKMQHHPDIKAKLEFIKDHRFLCTYYPERIGIEVFPFRIENGEVKGFSLKVDDVLEYTRYEFEKM